MSDAVQIASSPPSNAATPLASLVGRSSVHPLTIAVASVAACAGLAAAVGWHVSTLACAALLAGWAAAWSP